MQRKNCVQGRLNNVFISVSQIKEADLKKEDTELNTINKFHFNRLGKILHLI